MPKPRIIIADTDYSYIAPLQLKFAEEYFDKLDIEIITYPAFLDSFFSSPQKADILIISEELYSERLLRHNIGRIFVMTEQPTEAVGSGSLSVDYIYKYTSIKEIYNEITGKCADVLDVNKVNKKKTQIVVVCSAAGGTGKTTVAMGISACLTKNYKKVLYINADKLQTFHRLLTDRSPIGDASVYARLANPNLNMFNDIKQTVRKETFAYIPPFKSALMSLGIPFKMFAVLAESAKRSNMYDFVIVDVNSGFDENLALLLKIADKAIVVTKKTASSVFATRLFVSNINGIGSEKYIFLCNDCAEDEHASDMENAVGHAINEYIKHFENYDGLTCEDFMRDNSMQKIAFLLV